MIKFLKLSAWKYLLLAGLTAPALAAGDTPVDLIRDTSAQVLDALHKDNGGNRAKVREQVEALVLPKFDFKRMTALAMGVGWRQANAGQQAELAQQFQLLLVRSYTSTMNRYKNARIDVQPNAVQANGGREATVKSRVVAGDGSQPVSVDYTFYQSTQGWKVYNITVEGASLITAYRNNFNDEILKGGVDGLLKALKAKNASLASVKGTGV